MSTVFPQRYRLALRRRLALAAEPRVREAAARSKAAARDFVRVQHPERAIVAVEQLSGEDDGAIRALTAILPRGVAA